LIEGWDSERAHEMQLKNYIYFAMAFSFIVEIMNMKERVKRKPVQLRDPKMPEQVEPGDQAK
jgi:predicted tellurium resistance membrane protein TerC